MVYGAYKDLPIKIAANKLLPDKAFEIAHNQNFGGYQHGLASMTYEFLDKKSGDNIHRETGIREAVVENQQLANELHNSITRKLKTTKYIN